MHKRIQWFGTILGVALSLSLVAGIALAVNPNSTTLLNGAELSVQIDNPMDNEENKVPANSDGSAGGTTVVAINGKASIGEGEPDILVIFAIDGSFSALGDCGVDSDTILDCEKQAVLNVLADPNIQSVLEVGVVAYGEEGAAADMTMGGGDDLVTDPVANAADVTTVVNSVFIDPDGEAGDCPASINEFTMKNFFCDGTDFTAGLTAASSVVGASTAGIRRLFFLSDGISNQGGAGFDAAVAALADAGVQIDAFAVGGASSCTGGSDGTLQEMASATGGSCTELPDPADIITTLPDLIATSLDNVQVAVNDTDIPTNASPLLPAEGPVSASYDAAVNLGIGTYEISATAEGSDNAGSAIVAADVTKQVLQLIAGPFTETNELSEDNEHTVVGQILGGAGPARNIDFKVGGQNAATASPASGSILATPGGAGVPFMYMVPGNECASLGIDTITVSTTIAGMLDSTTLSKEWVDTIAPVADCVETVNPHGKKVPPAGSTTLPGPKGGQNDEGFYELEASDNLSGESCAPLQIFVTDTGSGTVFGPFGVGDKIKYTEASGAVPTSKKIGSSKGQAGAIAAHIIGNGDASVTAFDQSGNQSDPAFCLVPPPPK